MNRRHVITLLGGAAAWPLAARAQQGERVRRVGVLRGESESNPQTRAGLMAFRSELAKLGWTEGVNLHIEARFGNDDPERIRAYAIELAGLGPEAIMTGTRPATAEMARQTQSIPIVFTGVGDPLVYGLLKDPARPEGNLTGFNNYYPSIGGKWVELLKEAAPAIARVAIITNPATRTPAGSPYLPFLDAAARSLALELTDIPARNVIEIVRGIDAFAAQPNGSLLLLPGNVERDTIVRLAIEHRLPLISVNQFDAVAGALMTYTSDALVRYRGAASYVDRILRGAKVSDLPLVYPTKFALIINLKTAKALGLTVPQTLLATADEVIE
jgi:putative tryptophan/tyrosine transport system substrate-binding protein